MENVYELKCILEAGETDDQTDNPCRGVKFSLWVLVKGVASYLCSYFWSTLKTSQTVCYGVFADLLQSCRGGRSKSTEDSAVTAYRQIVLAEMRALLEPTKLAVAITTCSLFVILAPLNSEDYARNSSLAAFTIALVRRANSASSFLTGTQRMMGTVLGAVFSFTLFQALNCETTTVGHSPTCGPSVTIPVLMVWLCFCACFREGPQYGYAAVVAGFTPLVLFFSPSVHTQDGAWLRVEMTILGILVYLLIDNLVMPVRADDSLKLTLLGCLHDSRCALSTVVTCLKLVAGVPNQGADIAIEKQMVQVPQDYRGGNISGNDFLGRNSISLSSPAVLGLSAATPAGVGVGTGMAIGGCDKMDMLLLHHTRSRTARKFSIISEDSNTARADGGNSDGPNQMNPRSRGGSDVSQQSAGRDNEPDCYHPPSFWTNIWKCEDTVDDIKVHLNRLQSKIVGAKALLLLSPIEPHITG